MLMYLYTSKDINQWKSRMLCKGGRKIDLDWLLDMKAGLTWQLMQKIKLDSESSVNLRVPLCDLEELWDIHLNKNMPLQYLVGKCPWRDFELEVTLDVLIPRQETELIIDFALKNYDKKSKGIWADLGTGSGALAVALAKEFPLWDGHAVDCSEAALAIAKRNLNNLVKRNQVSLHLGNWWEPLTPFLGTFNLIVANPPYIPNAHFKKLSPIVSEHEPSISLCGGIDGLNQVRKVISGASDALCRGGLLIIEHHYDQSDRAIEMMRKANLVDLMVENDLEGVKRFAIGRRPK
tara:strand:- start:42 stop:917 length:876 start_codon:yes stop_codon:yes gene_type:complete